jgi:hypothetical protein
MRCSNELQGSVTQPTAVALASLTVSAAAGSAYTTKRRSK